MTLADLDELVARKLKHYTEICEETGCWNWVGGKLRAGYGVITVYVFGKKTSHLAHRVSYMLANQVTITRFQPVCHKCDNPSCINPDHLFLGTQKENLKDMVEKGRSLRGVKNSQAKLTENEVREIRALYALGSHSQRDLAKIYGIDQTTIGDVVNRLYWQHVC